MRALVLSGGGHLGAFEVGAARYLAEAGQTYDIFTGVSVGAINGAYLAMWEDFKQASLGLTKLWEPLKTRDIHRAWVPFGRLSIWQSGARNTRPLRDLVRGILDPHKIHEARNQCIVGAVSCQDFTYRTFHHTHPHFADAVIASSMFPIVFPPHPVGKHFYSDGGTQNTTPLKAAIDAGADQIDVVMTTTSSIDPWVPPTNLPEAAMRAFMQFIVGADRAIDRDLAGIARYNRLIFEGYPTKKRVITVRMIRPAEPLPGKLLEWDPAITHQLIDAGYQQARKVLTHG